MTVSVESLSMTYQVPIRPPGVKAALKSIVKPTFQTVEAVSDVSFEVGSGEIVGFIGPNGAGKTTTLKILSGILHPTAGEVRVLGFEPKRRDRSFLRQIALIRGSQAISGQTELTVSDMLHLQKLIYEVDETTFRQTLALTGDMLEIGHLLDRQVRALSLGERMRCGLALSLIYRPRILFLDEPTIGMDVSVVERTRSFIRDYVQATGGTVLLTSHYMADVDQLCKRVVLIDKGRLAYDGSLSGLTNTLSPYRLITLTYPEEQGTDWGRFGDITNSSETSVSIRVKIDDVPQVAQAIFRDVPSINDLTITQPALEQVLDRAYREGVA